MCPLAFHFLDPEKPDWDAVRRGHEGAPCPLCLQVVRRLPSADVWPNRDGIRFKAPVFLALRWHVIALDPGGYGSVRSILLIARYYGLRPRSSRVAVLSLGLVVTAPFPRLPEPPSAAVSTVSAIRSQASTP